MGAFLIRGTVLLLKKLKMILQLAFTMFSFLNRSALSYPICSFTSHVLFCSYCHYTKNSKFEPPLIGDFIFFLNLYWVSSPCPVSLEGYIWIDFIHYLHSEPWRIHMNFVFVRIHMNWFHSISTIIYGCNGDRRTSLFTVKLQI